MKTRKTKFTTALLVLFLSITVPAQSGGSFIITESVVAGGGERSAGGAFTIDGTVGQAVAGQRANNAAAVHAGFWNPQQFAPTAAEVAISGRATTADGRGIRNVRVTMTRTDGESRTTMTGTFGYFRFTDVPVGETFVFSVAAKRYTFSQSSQIRWIVEETDDINFTADEP